MGTVFELTLGELGNPVFGSPVQRWRLLQRRTHQLVLLVQATHIRTGTQISLEVGV